MKVELTRRVDGDRKALITESAECAPVVTPGRQYDLALWYKTTTPDAAITLFRHDTTAGWQYWTDLKTLDMEGDWNEAAVRTPEVPAGTDRISWGVSVYGTGSATTDDYTMEQVADPVPPPQCTGTAEQCANGSWSVLPTKNPVRSMHSVVLRGGKVLLIAGSGNDESTFEAGTFTSAVYDPEKGTYKVIPTPKDMFCAGHVQLQDGRVLVMSGNKGYPSADGRVGYQGYKDSYVFDPATETYTKTNDMNDGHWYPSATILGNGDVISFGGLKEDSTGSVTAELFSEAEQRWQPLWKVNQTWSYWGLYPSMILMQDGRLFYSGSHVFGNNIPGTGSAIYDYDANTITQVPGLRKKDERDQSASVLLPPAQDQKVLTLGGGNIDSNPEANRLTDIIDLKQPSPSYVAGPPIPQGTVDLGNGPVPQTGNQGKMYVSAVLLPDGKVLETGGALHNRANLGLRDVGLRPRDGDLRPGGRRSRGARLPRLGVPAAGRPRHDHRRQPGQRHLEPRRVGLQPALSVQGPASADHLRHRHRVELRRHPADHRRPAHRQGRVDPPGRRHALLRPEPAVRGPAAVRRRHHRRPERDEQPRPGPARLVHALRGGRERGAVGGEVGAPPGPAGPQGDGRLGACPRLRGLARGQGRGARQEAHLAEGQPDDLRLRPALRLDQRLRADRLPGAGEEVDGGPLRVAEGERLRPSEGQRQARPAGPGPRRGRDRLR
jgi:hypothetical protein